MRNGYVYLDKQILDSRLWSYSPMTVKIAIYLILSANHSTGYVRGVDILRGQTCRSLHRIADDNGASVKAVRHALKVLVRDGFITVDKPFGAKQGQRITVCNYDTYQNKKPRRGKAGANEGTKQGANEGTPNNKGEAKKTKENIYGEFENVKLSDEEYAKLRDGWGKQGKRFGAVGRAWAIEKLSQSIASKGYKYKDHYATIQGWVYDAWLIHRDKEYPYGNSEYDLLGPTAGGESEMKPSDTEANKTRCDYDVRMVRAKFADDDSARFSLESCWAGYPGWIEKAENWIESQKEGADA